MFDPIVVPFESKMLFNVIKLKSQYSIEDAELILGEMCNIVKNKYKNAGGFIAGQVFKSAGFISEEGSVGNTNDDLNCLHGDHIVIITYWSSFDQHETSHADSTFNDKFNQLKDICENTFELGYDLLWQGEPE